MKKLTIATLLFSSFGALAQSVTKEDLQNEIKPFADKVKLLQSENNKLKSDLGILNTKLLTATLKIDTLQRQTESNSTAINETSKELGLKISTTETNTNQKISAVDHSLGKSSLYGIIGVLSAVILSSLLFWLLSKRQKTDKTDFIDQLSKTKSSIEESLVKEFGKQTDLMETHLKIIEQQKNAIPTNSNAEPDHSLALKVADEITLIERNVNLMDSKTKGLKQLVASVSKLKDNLAANGYEMPELLGKQFHQGMKVIVASSIPDESLEKGSEVITKIIKPQVNFNDKMIQTAQIEVSVGY